MPPPRTAPTLGHLLRQARRAKGLSLRQTAAQVMRTDGRPISHQYLHNLEHDRRQASVHVLRQLARVLDLGIVGVLTRAHKVEAVIREYLHVHPDQHAAIIRLFLQALEADFAAWGRVSRQINALQSRPGA